MKEVLRNEKRKKMEEVEEEKQKFRSKLKKGKKMQAKFL